MVHVDCCILKLTITQPSRIYLLSFKTGWKLAVTKSTGEFLAALAVWLYGCQCLSISAGWIAIKFGADIHGAEIMDRNDFGDPLTFPLAPP